MSKAYKIRGQEKTYFVSFATINWIDVFVTREYLDIMVDSFKFCISQKGLDLYEWCIMSSHIHLIIGTRDQKIEDILRDMKRHTSEALLKAIKENPTESRREWMLWIFERAGKRNPNNEHYQFWQQDNQPKEIRGDIMAKQKLDYIHNKPVEAGFVAEPKHWLYSMAVDYYGGKGLLEITHIFG